MKPELFEDFLERKFAEDYHGTDDDMVDAFDHWMYCLDVNEVIDFANEYAAELIKKTIPF